MLWEIFVSAYNSIIANKIRSLLTIIGIVIGIAAVIAISGLGEGSKISVSENLKRFGTNRISIGLNYRATIADKDRFDFKDEELLRSYEEIREVSPVAIMSGRYVFENDYYTVSLRGCNQEYDKINQLEMMYGRFLSEGDIKSGSKVMVIDNVFAKMVFDRENVVGEKIKIRAGESYHNFIITGIYKNSNASNDRMFQRNFRAETYVPITLIKQIDSDFNINEYQANIADIKKLDTVSTDVAKLLELKHRNYNKYNVRSAVTMIESVTSILDTMTIFVSFVAAISLFVGGIGVMNIMLVSVTERTKEIGICKSLGASNSTIMIQFLTEAVILCSVGGILGVAGGYGGGMLLGKVIKVTPHISIETVLIAFGISTLIGVVFGVYPASKASKLNPIDALRYE